MNKSFVCPWWMGYMLLFPLRSLVHNPKKIVSPYVKPGMTVVDYGCAMGYFTIPMAGMVGETGKVVCFDIQQIMLDKLLKRARHAEVGSRLKTRLITGSAIDFEGMENVADFVLLFAVAHEVPDQEKLFFSLSNMMKKGSYLYFAEPSGHVPNQQFLRSIELAKNAGLSIAIPPKGKKLAVVFRKVE